MKHLHNRPRVPREQLLLVSILTGIVGILCLLAVLLGVRG